ncbi:hypothetical protein NDU88_002469 [Pleurodeles waltl]|uniref:Uncharacterized protein n=1 Tax=Pleurodeles waltl TaxID=8319 RepID=A0AAV7RBH6_PLEWA|nr:hypothetical protein NDU88_002469 [Pleurodeles waltl]
MAPVLNADFHEEYSGDADFTKEHSPGNHHVFIVQHHETDLGTLEYCWYKRKPFANGSDEVLGNKPSQRNTYWQRQWCNTT